MRRHNRDSLPHIRSATGISDFGNDSQYRYNEGNRRQFQEAFLQIGVVSKQGKRPYQEDEHSVAPFLKDSSSSGKVPETHMFALFDGHAGGRCSKFLSSNLAAILSQDPDYGKNLPEALKRSFQLVNQQFLRIADEMNYQDGSTGIVVLVRDGKYLIANVGDCRAIILSDNKVVQLSKDQKPTNVEEQRRIIRLGGTLVNCFGIVRVNGVLAVSRAFGNRNLRQIIRPDAEITQRNVRNTDDFLVMGSDGLWDALSNKQVNDICYRLMSQSCESIADELVNQALTKGSQDNVTCIVVKLRDFVARGEEKKSSGMKSNDISANNTMMNYQRGNGDDQSKKQYSSRDRYDNFSNSATDRPFLFNGKEASDSDALSNTRGSHGAGNALARNSYLDELNVSSGLHRPTTGATSNSSVSRRGVNNYTASKRSQYGNNNANNYGPARNNGNRLESIHGYSNQQLDGRMSAVGDFEALGNSSPIIGRRKTKKADSSNGYGVRRPATQQSNGRSHLDRSFQSISSNTNHGRSSPWTSQSLGGSPGTVGEAPSRNLTNFSPISMSRLLHSPISMSTNNK